MTNDDYAKADAATTARLDEEREASDKASCPKYKPAAYRERFSSSAGSIPDRCINLGREAKDQSQSQQVSKMGYFCVNSEKGCQGFSFKGVF